MWACKLLTWDARRAEGLGKSPGGCGGRGGDEGGGGAAGGEEGTGRDLVISGTVSVSLADRRKKNACVVFSLRCTMSWSTHLFSHTSRPDCFYY